MKKTLSTVIALLAITVSAYAQNVINPSFAQTDDYSTIITKIETTGQHTIVTFETTAQKDSSWIQVNKEIFLQTNLNNAHYDFVKAENLTIAPAKQYIKKTGDKLVFKIFFKKIPATTKMIDIIERAGGAKNGVGYFNYYDVSLIQGTGQPAKVTDVILTPPPAATANNITNAESVLQMFNGNGPEGSFFTNMQKAVMDFQLQYYKQPGKLAEYAKLNKQYFDELVKVGFTYDQALKIITSDGLMPKSVVK